MVMHYQAIGYFKPCAYDIGSDGCPLIMKAWHFCHGGPWETVEMGLGLAVPAPNVRSRNAALPGIVAD